MLISGISNFDKSKYSGTWYEYANVFEFYDIGAECIRATYTDDGETIGVFNEALNFMYIAFPWIFLSFLTINIYFPELGAIKV